MEALLGCVTAILALISLSAAGNYDVCKPHESVPCPYVGGSCAHVYWNHSSCCAYCARREGQTCGGFMNVAGDCEPLLKCVYRVGSLYGEDRVGRCEKGLARSCLESIRLHAVIYPCATGVCTNLMCGYRQRCVRKEGCTCPVYNCMGKRNHVCGHDGQTYRSICHLQEEECFRGYYIGIKSMGKCPQACSSGQPEKPVPPVCVIIARDLTQQS